MTSDRTPRHTRTSIVDVALRLLDDVGIADLSMRRLAGELRIQPSALYWHFENKQTLLAAVADRIVDAADLEQAATVTEVADRLRAALLRHQDGAEVVLSTAALALGAGAARAALMRTAGGGSDRAARAEAMFHFVLGNTSLLQQRLHARRFGVVTGDPEEMLAAADAAYIAGREALVR